MEVTISIEPRAKLAASAINTIVATELDGTLGSPKQKTSLDYKEQKKLISIPMVNLHKIS